MEISVHIHKPWTAWKARGIELCKSFFKGPFYSVTTQLDVELS